MKSKLFYLSAVVALLASCAEAEVESPTLSNDRDTQLSFTVAASNTNTSKVVVSEDSESTDWVVSWKEDDALALWDMGVDSESDAAKFTIVNFGSASSDFTGDLSSTTTSAIFMHPYIESLAKSSHKVALDMSTPASDGSFDTLGETTYMVSEQFATASTTNLTMRHVGAAIELQLRPTSLSDLTLKKVTLEGVGSDTETFALPIKANLDLSADLEGDYLTDIETGAIEIAVDDVAADDDNIYTIRFNCLPFELPVGAVINITAEFEDADGTPYSTVGQVSNSTTETLSFERATKSVIKSSTYVFGVEYDADAFANVGAEGGDFTFSIISTANCTLKVNQLATATVTLDTYSTAPTSLEPIVVTATIDANTTASALSAKITITPTVGTAVVINVSQEGAVILDLTSDLNTILASLNTGMATPVVIESWTGDDITTWAGVGTETIDGDLRVVSLDLSGYGFVGTPTFPTLIAETLKELDLSDNGYDSDVPTSLNNLTALETLNLSGNNFTRMIFGNFANLQAGLKKLDISNNSIVINTNAHFPALALFSELEYLDFSNNSTTVIMHADMAKLTNLKYLDASNNSMPGTPPAGLAAIEGLETFKVSGNKMTGTLDAAFANHPHYFDWNAFENIFPQQGDDADAAAADPSQHKLKFNSLGAMRVFYWATDGANWTWSTATAFADVTEPEWLYGFADTGVFPTTDAKTNYVGVRCTTKGLIEVLGGQSALDYGTGDRLYGLTGELPNELLMACSAMTELRLAKNSGLTGEVPLLMLNKLNKIDLQSCGISMDIDTFIDNLADTFAECDMSGNDMYGTNGISDQLITKFNPAGVAALKFSGNANLSGALSQELVDDISAKTGYTNADIVTYITYGTSLTAPNITGTVTE